MSPHGLVTLKELKAMLEDCAPRFKIIEKEHHFWVTWSDRTYRGLPKGGHGKLEIHRLHVNKLARHLKIDRDCVDGHFPP